MGKYFRAEVFSQMTEHNENQLISYPNDVFSSMTGKKPQLVKITRPLVDERRVVRRCQLLSGEKFLYCLDYTRVLVFSTEDVHRH